MWELKPIFRVVIYICACHLGVRNGVTWVQPLAPQFS
jgi:hypothetical protein